MLSLVVARARDGAIGRDGDIPWHVPEDLALFQRETVGGAIIMGRRTWESLPVRPLKGRFNIVVTSREAAGADHVARSVEAAVAAAREAGRTRVYGIGGAGIYAALMPLADRLVLTEVDLAVPDADTHFPPVEEGRWREVSRMVVREEGPRCVLRDLVRRAGG